MAAIRFRGEFRTSTNLLYTIDIYDQEYNGSVVPFKLGSQGFRLQYRGENNNMFTPIVGSELEFDMMIENATHEQFITDIAASPESRFWIGIYKGPGAQDLWWCGIVTPDIARSEDAAYPFAFSVRAVDGLGLLKTIDYASDEGLSVTGVERIITIIERCLNFLPHISHYYNQSDFFINTSVNWYENSHSYTNTYDPLYYTYANNFVTSSADDQAQWYNENNFKYLTVYEVLSSLLTIFGARITHYGGVFYIEQIETRTSDTFFSRRYGYPVVSPVAIDLQGTTSIASNQQVRRKLTGGTFTWFPSLKKATLTYKTKNRRNFWPPFRWGFLGGYGNNDFIERDTGIDINIQFPQQLIFSGNLRFTINSASYATSQIAPGSSYLIVAYIGVIAEESPGNTKSLLRQATDNGFSIVYGPTRWELGNTSRYAFAGSFFKMPETGDAPLSMNIPISFTTPHIQGTLGAVVGRLKLSFTIGLYGPDADDNYTFNFLDPDLMQDYNWALQNPFMELTAVGFQNTSTNEKIYTITSDTVGSTAEYEATVFWADGDTVNTVGRLQTESGGVYTDTDSWGVKTTSGNKLIQELLLERMMRMQRNPVMKYDGTVYGPDFAIYKTLVDTQSRKWMFLAGSYTANLDQWQGEWANIGVYSSGTFEIVATDAEMFPGGYYPAGPVVDTSTESIVPGNIAPATLEPLAAAVVAVSYPSGSAPGSGISINSVLGAGAFVQGQQIAIVNPSSGQFAYFEVTTDSIAGDTTIGISGSFPSRFPAGSYVINLPSNYTVSGGVGPAQGAEGSKWADDEFDPPTIYRESNAYVIRNVTGDASFGVFNTNASGDSVFDIAGSSDSVGNQYMRFRRFTDDAGWNFGRTQDGNLKVIAGSSVVASACVDIDSTSEIAYFGSVGAIENPPSVSFTSAVGNLGGLVYISGSDNCFELVFRISGTGITSGLMATVTLNKAYKTRVVPVLGTFGGSTLLTSYYASAHGASEIGIYRQAGSVSPSTQSFYMHINGY